MFSLHAVLDSQLEILFEVSAAGCNCNTSLLWDCKWLDLPDFFISFKDENDTFDLFLLCLHNDLCNAGCILNSYFTCN